MCKVSVIVTTYNRPHALLLVLQSLQAQTHQPHDVIIADDGSNEETASLLRGFCKHSSLNVLHVWQKDCGFRAAKIRNKAAVQASGDYLIFLDGDCVPTRYFVEHHVSLAETTWFVAGNRLLLSESFTKVCESSKADISDRSKWYWIKQRFLGHVNRVLPLMTFQLRGHWRKRKAERWQGAKSCNLAVWRSDLFKVNGFDEAFEGWGHEDAALVVRLIHGGILRKEGRMAVPVFHLWHAEYSRTNENDNFQHLQTVINDVENHWANKGVDQYL